MLTDDILSKVHIPVVALNCKNTDCTDLSHVVEVNTFYENVISAIVSADTEAFAKVRDGRRGKAYTVQDGLTMLMNCTRAPENVSCYGVMLESHDRVRYLT